MNETKVTVVVPSWRQGQFIGDCIRSLLAQDHRNLEVLVFDNLSDDTTAEVLRTFRDERLRIVFERDSGQADAIAKGLKAASGELFGWLNADDYLPQGAIRATVEAYHQCPNAAVFYGILVLVDTEGRCVQVCVPKTVTRQSVLEGRTAVLQPGSLHPTSVVRAAGGVDPNLHMCMDLDLWLRVLRQGDAVFVPSVVAFMRVYDSAKTFRFPLRNGLEHLKVALREGAGPASWTKLLMGFGIATLKELHLLRAPVLARAEGAKRSENVVCCRYAGDPRAAHALGSQRKN
jgi:glycosyltransferase involved in cell wall biosynthesis